MALDPLATAADLTARGVTVDPSETAIVATYLDVASAVIREAAGSPVSETSSAVVLEGDRDTRLRLPGQPVTAVSGVFLDGTEVTDHRLVNGSLWRAEGWRGPFGPSLVDVVLTHGLPEVPADIVDMVCRLAAQALSAYRSGDPVARQISKERIGDYSVDYATDAETGVMSLTDFQRSRLAARFGNSGAVVVRLR